MTDTFANLEEAVEAAGAQFLRQAAHKAFSSPVATHYHLQALGNGSVTLSLGSIGTVTQADGKFLPVADVVGTFTVSPEMLDTMARIILVAHYPEDTQEDENADG